MFSAAAAATTAAHQVPCLLQQLGPSLALCLPLQQRAYAQAARGRKKATTASAAETQEETTGAASLHISEAMSASQAQAAAAGGVQQQARGGQDMAQKQRVLNDTIKKLNKRMGSGTLMRLGEAAPRHIDCTPSGCLTLDLALGGGWARGRVVEVYGPEASGKTTLALHAVAEVQKAGGQAVFVDAEHAFNVHFAKRLGVNVEDLIICQPCSGEDALEVVDEVLRSHAVDLVAVDSVAALLPRAELEGHIGDPQVASQARLMSAGLRKIAANAHRSNTTVMFINQLRLKVGVLFGNPETTSGGNALKFYASQRVDVRAKEKVKDGDKVETGIRVKATVVKNKVAPPYRSASFVIAFNKGIDGPSNLLEACLAAGVVQPKGSYYFLGEQRLGQGKEAVAAAVAADEALAAHLTAEVRRAMAAEGRLGSAAQAAAEDSDAEFDEEAEQQAA